MTKQLFTIYDIVAQTIVGPIIAEVHQAPAIRAFHDALAQPNSLLAQHPGDFTLLLIGELTLQGQYLANDLYPQTIATGSAWLADKETRNNA